MTKELVGSEDGWLFFHQNKKLLRQLGVPVDLRVKNVHFELGVFIGEEVCLTVTTQIVVTENELNGIKVLRDRYDLVKREKEPTDTTTMQNQDHISKAPE